MLVLSISMIFNFCTMFLEQWVMVHVFNMDQTMAWIVVMFLMVIYEFDEFMYPGLTPHMDSVRKRVRD